MEKNSYQLYYTKSLVKISINLLKKLKKIKTL